MSKTKEVWEEKREEWIEQDNREKLLRKAANFYTKLRLELATRSDNEHVGSGMGGNASEFFFLLSHKVELATSPDMASFSRVGDNKILFQVPVKSDLKQARKELTKFFNSHPDKLEITQEQLLDTAFLKEYQSKSLEIKLLARAVEEAKLLSQWLDKKITLQSNIRKAFDEEYKSIEASFLKEMDLPLTYFSDQEEDEADVDYTSLPIGSMLTKHPVWGVRKQAVTKRKEDMLKHLLSQEDLERTSFVGSFPVYTTLFAFRACINIERIVSLNLDELPECAFLGKINKIIEGKDKESDED